MVKSFLRQSPLSHLHLETRIQKSAALPESGVRVAEKAFHTQITVRGQSSDPAFLQGVEKALGIPLPVMACTASGHPGKVQVLWMGPDEWLIVTPKQESTKIIQVLAKALRGLHTAIVDVSESRTRIQMQGPNAKSVLNKGCAIDLHPSAFGPGQVVNTLLGRAHITLHQTGFLEGSDDPSYDIYVHRSFAEYLWTWIEDASREYGLDVVRSP